MADIWRDVCDPSNPHDRDVQTCLDACQRIYEVLECEDYLLPPSDQADFERAIDDLLLSYRALNVEARDSDTNRWHEVPKHHYLQHLALMSKFMNPRFGWCYPDEDFMRIMKAALNTNRVVNPSYLCNANSQAIGEKSIIGTAAVDVARKIVERWTTGILVRLDPEIL